MLEWRLGRSEIIQYSGDLTNPPDNVKQSSRPAYLTNSSKKTIRGKDEDDSDSDFELE